MAGLFDYVDNQYQVNGSVVSRPLHCAANGHDKYEGTYTDNASCISTFQNGSTRVASQNPNLPSSILASIRFARFLVTDDGLADLLDRLINKSARSIEYNACQIKDAEAAENVRTRHTLSTQQAERPFWDLNMQNSRYDRQEKKEEEIK